MTDGLPTPRRYQAIVALSFGTALVVIDGGIANVALPTIARDLGVTNSASVAVVTIYQLTLVMLLLPLSGLGERLGLKRAYQGDSCCSRSRPCCASSPTACRSC